MSTPHIAAEPGDFAPTVLMPGDPLRAKMIAERYLEDAREITSVRNMLGFTGTYKGDPISVMGSGMGVPSVSIYASELFDQYGVEQIIRVGSCGALQEDLPVGGVIIASGAGTDSNVNRVRAGGHDFAAVPDFGLLRAAVESAETLGLAPVVGRIFTSDHFYHPDGFDAFEPLKKAGFLAVEMEAAALYGVAIERNKKALCIVTVSDQIITGEMMTAEERQETLDQMIQIALEAAASN